MLQLYKKCLPVFFIKQGHQNIKPKLYKAFSRAEKVCSIDTRCLVLGITILIVYIGRRGFFKFAFSFERIHIKNSKTLVSHGCSTYVLIL